MNCFTHVERNGIAVCVNCGAVICAECIKKSLSNKNVCSEQCASAASEADRVLSTIASKVTRSNKVTAWFCWSLGAIFCGLGAVASLSDSFFAAYLITGGIIFVGSGFWYNNVARKSI